MWKSSGPEREKKLITTFAKPRIYKYFVGRSGTFVENLIEERLTDSREEREREKTCKDQSVVI